MGFLDAIAGSERVSIIAPPDEGDEGALRWLRQHDERAYSYVDAASFVTMRANRITHALAFDGNFQAAGFVELRPAS